jgi:hypothetical protein
MTLECKVILGSSNNIWILGYRETRGWIKECKPWTLEWWIIEILEEGFQTLEWTRGFKWFRDLRGTTAPLSLGPLSISSQMSPLKCGPQPPRSAQLPLAPVSLTVAPDLGPL